MSLSGGGGFQILRLRILFSVSIRELVRQLHPRAIVKIRVGKEIIADKNVRQVVVFQFLFLSIVFSTSLLLTLLGVSIYDAFVSAVNALATAGPIRGVDGAIIDIAAFSSGERLALLPAMLSGRLYLLPVFVTLGYLLSESRNFLRPRRRYLRWKSSFKS
jgi:trk system potassium uptake protein TrkH